MSNNPPDIVKLVDDYADLILDKFSTSEPVAAPKPFIKNGLKQEIIQRIFMISLGNVNEKVEAEKKNLLSKDRMFEAVKEIRATWLPNYTLVCIQNPSIFKNQNEKKRTELGTFIAKVLRESESYCSIDKLSIPDLDKLSDDAKLSQKRVILYLKKSENLQFLKNQQNPEDGKEFIDASRENVFYYYDRFIDIFKEKEQKKVINNFNQNYILMRFLTKDAGKVVIGIPYI